MPTRAVPWSGSKVNATLSADCLQAAIGDKARGRYPDLGVRKGNLGNLRFSALLSGSSGIECCMGLLIEIRAGFVLFENRKGSV